MAPFFLVFLAVAAATLGGPEAVGVARLSARLGGGAGLLMACWVACILACVLAAWLGDRIAAQLGPEAKPILVAVALLFAAIELTVLRPGPAPAEPTRSLGAILIVLSAVQFMTPGGFLVFALAAATGAPWLAAAGGAIGSAAVLTAAWSAGEQWEAHLSLGVVRYAVAGLLAAAALVTGLNARSIMG